MCIALAVTFLFFNCGYIHMSLSPISFNISSFVDTIINNVRKGLHLLVHYARVVVHYIWQYLKLAWRTVARYFAIAQTHPKETLQFAGTMLILINSGVL